MQAGMDDVENAHFAFLRGATPDKPTSGNHIVSAVESTIVAEYLRNVFSNGDDALFDVSL